MDCENSIKKLKKKAIHKRKDINKRKEQKTNMIRTTARHIKEDTKR
jgi:hypothetical protein